MRKVTLIFPNTSSLAEFIITYRVKQAEINSLAQALTAVLSQEEIETACKDYGAVIEGQFFFSLL